MTDIKKAMVLSLVLVASACGSTGSPAAPTTPTGTQLLVPTGFYQTAQKVNATSNEFQLAWDGNGTSYQLVIGTSPGSSNVLTVEVTGTTYTWVSPRTGGAYYARVAARRGDSISAYSTELSLFVLDVRNVVDALFFHAGPMADSPTNALTNPVASVWADGVRLNIVVSTEAGDTARVNARTFTDLYSSLFGGTVTATYAMTSDAMHGVDYRTLPNFTIGVRVQSGFCGGALACVPVNSGPAPAGPNRSIVTLEQAGGLYVGATAHEMGHAFGLGHVTIPVAGRPELRFMMSPVNASEQMTDAEKVALTFARQGGIRPGMTRAEALALGLVNP